ncbi:aminopeptidase P family protein [Cohnella endophytica]|uniref:Aminopeptidase P family protein n=1 Tax=Cohnella endophytica TaxID=2419778 RepID=A0A494X527_9BACL|nr:Xaa-Pro peptidase family protein [Cohnella endophytica]RKP45805.1 aminopeptidase P family protein [Cohnella endophytica]
MHIDPPREEWLNRQQRLQERMAQVGLQGCLVSQNVGIYYFTGSMQTGYLFVPVDGTPTYYVRRSLARAQAESHVRTEELISFRTFGQQLATDYPEVFPPETKTVAIGADLDVMPAQLYLRLTEAIPQASLKDASALLRIVRSVKSAFEIERISNAAAIVAKALESGIDALKEGMTELELMTVIEGELRRDGHIGLMRMRGYNQEIMTGVVAAGDAAAEPTYFDGPAGGRGLTPAGPQSSSRRPIRRNEPILIDIGCCVDGYTIDQTRTAVIGEMSTELLAAYETATAIMRHSEKQLRPGTAPEQLYAEALRIAEAAGLSEHFMGFGRDQVKFLGHGIGLEIDEWPVLARGFRDPLEPGMTIAVEPKFTFPGVGVVGVENTYLITETGCRPLTVSPERIYSKPAR